MNTQHILQSTPDFQSIIIVILVMAIIEIIILAICNYRFSEKNKMLGDRIEYEKERHHIFKKSFERSTEEIVDKHLHELEARSNIAYANIKRCRDEIRVLKDQHRATALEKAMVLQKECGGLPKDVTMWSKEIYKFLIGK